MGMPDHTNDVDGIDRSENPDEVTKSTLIDYQDYGYGLVVPDGDDAFIYEYNFTSIGTVMTIEYLFNSDKDSDFLVGAVGRYCSHNDTFLLGRLYDEEDLVYPSSAPTSAAIHKLPKI